MDDQEIIELFFARNDQALFETKEKYHLQLYRCAMNILRNNQDAEECINDTLLKAWQSIPPAKPEVLRAFLLKITRNLSLNKWKEKTAQRRGGSAVDLLLSELEDCIPATTIGVPEEEYEANLITETINQFLESLEQSARVTFVLRYFHGDSIRDIGERLSMSESKVKSLLFRTRKKLKSHLEKEGVTL